MVVMTVLMVVAMPLTLLAGLLVAAGAIQRRREARIARQVAVTDAIHRELGAVVAPVVRRGWTRGWRAEIAVPFESPALVGRVGAIAHAAMARFGSARPVELVLREQEPAPGAERARPRREVIAWTGTSMSRAS
jgi:hypothetical protein